MQDLRQLDEEGGARCEFPHQGFVERLGLRRGVQRRHVVHHQPQAGRGIHRQQGAAQQLEGRVRHVQRLAGVGETLQAIGHAGLQHLSVAVHGPDLGIANAAPERVPGEAREIFGKFRFRRIQTAHHADTQRIGFGAFENPQIVLDPGAGLHHDGADDSNAFDLGAVVVRRGDLRRLIARAGIRHPLRPARIEQMDMGINDRQGRR